ncbi:LAETG motif-containing sortase-dependent surface protein [Streptomyces sp. NPDC001070]
MKLRRTLAAAAASAALVPADVDESEPRTGGKTPVTKPSGDTEIGSQAETGTSSSLPLIATVGGVAMVVGAGTIFTVRRRRSGAAA